MPFLPVTKKEMEQRGWAQCDFVYVCGDAYVDHSSFGAAIISRTLEVNGYKVGMICQPDWKDPESINVFGEPRLGFLVSSGNMDSMVNHYTVAKKRRHEDAYSPGGEIGHRPDRAVIVYCNLIRRTYKHTPIIIGGIEASLRRMAHYDYWSDSVRRSILLESGADLISYGMGEHSIVEIADALASGLRVQDITYIRGTVFKTRDLSLLEEADASDITSSMAAAASDNPYTGKPNALGVVRLPDYETIVSDKKAFAASVRIQYENTDPFTAHRMYESYGGKTYVVQNPPSTPLTETEMDDVYALPYMNAYHPMYEKQGGIPAIKEIRFSLTSNRGCYGGCNFCALTFHQGRIVQARSHASILAEAKAMTKDPDFKGYINDVGGPTAEFRRPACDKQLQLGACTGRQCLFPKPCPNLVVDHSDYIKLLREIRELPGVKKVFVRSGFRFDYVVADKDKSFLKEICKYHVSGQLRVAPEHITDNVLKEMGKPDVATYNEFIKEFEKINAELLAKGQLKNSQYVVPYLMSSHPGSRLADAIALAEYLHKHRLDPDQVQDYYPTPGTISTCMYYTGIDPRTMKPVYVAKDPHEKAMQRALIQYRRPENYDLVKEALLKEGREDLIGFGADCLIPPRKMQEHWREKGRNDVSGSRQAGGKKNQLTDGKRGQIADGKMSGQAGGKKNQLTDGKKSQMTDSKKSRQSNSRKNQPTDMKQIRPVTGRKIRNNRDAGNDTGWNNAANHRKDFGRTKNANISQDKNKGNFKRGR